MGLNINKIKLKTSILCNPCNKNKVDINYGLNLFVPEDYNIAANRAILDTDRSIPGQQKVKLILTYTVIK